MSKTFCILPFVHLEARSDSFVAPCCMSQEFYTKDTGEFFSLSKDTLSDVWNSSSIRNLRTSLLEGKKPTACAACWKEEEFGKESKRIRENKRWNINHETFTPERINSENTVCEIKFLDLKLGNTCNLKCRICSPGSSSNWVKEHKDIYGSDIVTDIGQKVNADRKQVMQWPDYNENFWTDLNTILPNVELFEIYGGEPFLISRHFQVLQKSIEMGYSKKQKIHYNTNGTIFPEIAVKEIWPHFEDVDIMLSIDGIGPQFEYQRYPAKWDSVLNNIQRFKNEFSGRTQICLTVSSINVFYLPEYLEFFQSQEIPVWLNILYHPEVLSIVNLSSFAKDKISEKINKYTHLNTDLTSVLNFMNAEGKNLEQEFIHKMKTHDEYRKQNYASVFEEFSNILTL
jgi:MoaA/NifB/PqqE/SkfB family radical SAM enzyme